VILTNEDRGLPESGSATVTVIIPCRAEYVAIGRLAILGVANRLAYSYDEVEDIRLAVGEACTHAVERAHTSQLPATLEPRIWIESVITPDGLNIEVRDNVPPGSAPESFPDLDGEDVAFDKQDLGAILIEILVDEVTVDSRADGTAIRLFKRSPQEPASVA
jgi:serine/threonine-protein kinase RsbW